MSDRRLGVAVVGLGVGMGHARGYLGTGRCDLRYLLDLDVPKANAAARELGARAVARDFQQILDDPAVDVVSIASFDDAHYDQVMQALAAKKHVFVEKPICQTIDQLADIKAAWQRHGGRVKLGSNLILRAAPLYRWLREQAVSGALGQIYAFDGDYLYGRIHKITEGWRSRVPGYSVMEGGGIHLIDLMLWIARERPTRVMAMGNRIATEGTPFQSQDYVTALLEFPSGLVGRIGANFGCVHRHHHVMRIFGTKGSFLYDDAGPRWHSSRDPALAPSPVRLDPLPAAKGDLLPAFVDAILHDKDVSADTQAFMDGLSIAAACDEAARTLAPTKVRYV